MSDRSIPRHLRDPSKPPPGLPDSSKQNWIKNAKKALQNYVYQQKFPKFYVPSSIYKLYHVHRYITDETIDILIQHVQNCHLFSLDTESQGSPDNLALLQIQSIPYQLPFFVMLVEFQHLPSVNSPISEKIKLLFHLVFRSTNKLYGWGNMTEELRPIRKNNLFDWLIAAEMFNTQNDFLDWYRRALSTCEICRLTPRRRTPVYDINQLEYYEPIQSCIDHYVYLYRSYGEKWSLQTALVHTSRLFLDKSSTCSDWAAGLDPMCTNLPSHRRRTMIEYAIYDCFGVTYFIRAIEQNWSIEKVRNANVVDLFQAPTPSPQYETISDDDIDEQPINEDIDIDILSIQAPVFVDDDLHDDFRIIDDDSRVFTRQGVENVDDNDQNVKKRQNTRHQRNDEYRKRRNKKRTNYFRSQRYRYFISRQFYHRFTMATVRNILDKLDIHFTHVKDEGDLLVIGLKDEQRQQEYEQLLPRDVFDRSHY